MAEETKKNTEPTEITEEVETKVKKKSFFNQKIFIIGLPLFVFQLVAVYFITANILLNKVQGYSPDKETEISTEKSSGKDSKNKEVELGKYIYLIEDIIVNPAGTEGKKLLLVSIGFDLSSEEEQNELKNKEILVKDVIISTLSSKTLEQLSNNSFRETLKTDIAGKIKELIPKIQLNTVYLSKYIIQ